MKQTLTAVSLSEVLDRIGFNTADDADIREYGFTPVVTWGDARHTLVGARFALERILYATEQDITEQFWAIVNENDFIDLEN